MGYRPNQREDKWIHHLSGQSQFDPIRVHEFFCWVGDWDINDQTPESKVPWEGFLQNV